MITIVKGCIGVQVNLTDGRTVQLGCVNTTDGRTGCVPGQLDAGIRTAAFHFAPGERVSALSLFAGPDNRGAANARAGAIRFSTSLVRRSLSCPCPPFVLPNVLFVSGKSAKAQTSQGCDVSLNGSLSHGAQA